MDDPTTPGDGDEHRFEGVAPPVRVQLVYRPRGSAGDVELPLRLLMLGDFTLRPDPRPLHERAPLEIDKESFSAVMLKQKLDISFSVDETLSGEPDSKLDVRLRFRRISDMEPEAIANQVPQLKALLELRMGLTAIKGPLGGEKAFRNRLRKYVEDPVARRRLREEIGLPGVDEAVTPPLPVPLPPEIAAVRDQALDTGRADTLRELAEHHAPAVREAVARNPDAPPDVLFKLSHYFPDEVAHNPVLPLLAIEVADWLSRLSAACLREVLRLGLVAAPESLLVQMSASSEAATRGVAAEDPRTPPAALDALAGDGSWYVAPVLVRNPSLPLATWRTLVADPERVARGAHYLHAPVEWLRAQAASPSVAVREAVAFHPRLPADAVAPLASDPEADVRSQVARRADLSPDLARALAVDADMRVRGQIAANPRTPADLLPALAEQCGAVRNGLLGNRAAPPALRERVCARNRDEWEASALGTVMPLISQKGLRR